MFVFVYFCYLSWATLCNVAFSDYFESILFHVGSRKFEISTKLAVIVAQRRGQMICNKEKITVIITMMFVASLCARCLRFFEILVWRIHGNKH